MGKPVDVIVPIFGAPDDVRRCVDSLLERTEHSDVRFILSDDASPQARIEELLDEYSKDPRVTVVRAEENRGFVRNCNEAMRGSNDDVVLLNSDTVVGRGWLRRLQRYAYLFDRVGSVTPISNNAEVCSSPMWFETNHYPARIGVVEIDQAASNIATYAPIELPTGVGFCLYLRRSALDEVGIFDEDAFGRGYGEENDLCVRMRHNGYLNLLADGVFVEHRGKGSFGDDGQLQENLGVMRDRWPGYPAAISGYRQADSLRGVRSRLGYEIAGRHRDPQALRPLYVLHYRTRIGRKGGTEHQTQDLIDAAGDALDPMILTYEKGQPIVQWDADSAGMAFPGAISPADQESGDWLGRVLDSGVDLLHVQQPIRVPLRMLELLHEEANTREIPVVWTLHDFSTTCPCVQLVHPDGSRCPVPDGGDCADCETLSLETDQVGLGERRQRLTGLVRSADYLIVPSETAAEIQKEFLELKTPPNVIPHGISGEPNPVPPPTRKRPLLTVLGYSAPQKGTALARELIDVMGNSVEWLFLGRDHLPGFRGRRNVSFGGTYEREALQGIFEEVAPDAVVLLSNWPETYLYTLSEAWRSGIPVFGTDVGAMGERVRRREAGVLLDPTDAHISAQSIKDTLADASKMARLREAAIKAGEELPSLRTMADRYLELYNELVPRPYRTASVTHPPTIPEEWGGWIGSYPVPFPAESAFPVRIE